MFVSPAELKRYVPVFIQGTIFLFHKRFCHKDNEVLRSILNGIPLDLSEWPAMEEQGDPDDEI